MAKKFRIPKSELQKFELVYSLPGAIWTVDKAPKDLTNLLDSGFITPPGRVLDIGCGEGNYSLYLAKRGFDVTGLDFSPNGLSIAMLNARKARAKINFVLQDLREVKPLPQGYDFAFEWAIMHHIPFDERKSYLERVANSLKQKGKYLSVSWNIKDPEFGELGQPIRKTPLGTLIYFSSLKDVASSIGDRFNVLKSEYTYLTNRNGKKHFANLVLAERK